MALVAPALLSADFARLGEAIEAIRAGGASMIHIDVADGHFGPEVTVGQPVVASIRRHTNLMIDLRLAVERPERYVRDFLESGANRVAVHPESTRQLFGLVELIRAKGAKAGVALNPETPVDSLTDVLGEIDSLTIVSANLGVDGTFIPWSTAKVRQAARRRTELGLDFDLQVEGGIELSHIQELIAAGADILVAGSAIFKGGNPKSKLAEMIRLASKSPLTLEA